MKISSSLFTLMILSIEMFSQDLNESDIKSRVIANNLLEEHFSERLIDRSNLVFSIADTWYLFLIELNDSYTEYFVHRLDSIKSEIVKTTEINKSSNPEVLKEAFDSEIYKRGYITFNTSYYRDGYELANGNLTYFRFQDKKGEIFGESRLSVIVKPNPIDNKVYTYFVKRLLKLISN